MEDGQEEQGGKLSFSKVTKEGKIQKIRLKKGVGKGRATLTLECHQGQEVSYKESANHKLANGSSTEVNKGRKLSEQSSGTDWSKSKSKGQNPLGKKPWLMGKRTSRFLATDEKQEDFQLERNKDNSEKQTTSSTHRDGDRPEASRESVLAETGPARGKTSSFLSPEGGRKKRKIHDLLGPAWSQKELEAFYQAYRQCGKNWEQVASKVPRRTEEMVESLFNMNRAYLSLPEGAASVAGLVAMMTDHYSIMEQSKMDNFEEDTTRLKFLVSEMSSDGSLGIGEKTGVNSIGKDVLISQENTEDKSTHSLGNGTSGTKGPKRQLARLGEDSPGNDESIPAKRLRNSSGSRQWSVGRRTPRFQTGATGQTKSGLGEREGEIPSEQDQEELERQPPKSPCNGGVTSTIGTEVSRESSWSTLVPLPQDKHSELLSPDDKKDVYQDGGAFHVSEGTPNSKAVNKGKGKAFLTSGGVGRSSFDKRVTRGEQARLKELENDIEQEGLSPVKDVVDFTLGSAIRGRGGRPAKEEYKLSRPRGKGRGSLLKKPNDGKGEALVGATDGDALVDTKMTTNPDSKKPDFLSSGTEEDEEEEVKSDEEEGGSGKGRGRSRGRGRGRGRGPGRGKGRGRGRGKGWKHETSQTVEEAQSPVEAETPDVTPSLMLSGTKQDYGAFSLEQGSGLDALAALADMSLNGLLPGSLEESPATDRNSTPSKSPNTEVTPGKKLLAKFGRNSLGSNPTPPKSHSEYKGKKFSPTKNGTLGATGTVEGRLNEKIAEQEGSEGEDEQVKKGVSSADLTKMRAEEDGDTEGEGEGSTGEDGKNGEPSGIDTDAGGRKTSNRNVEGETARETEGSVDGGHVTEQVGVHVTGQVETVEKNHIQFSTLGSGREVASQSMGRSMSKEGEQKLTGIACVGEIMEGEEKGVSLSKTRKLSSESKDSGEEECASLQAGEVSICGVEEDGKSELEGVVGMHEVDRQARVSWKKIVQKGGKVGGGAFKKKPADDQKLCILQTKLTRSSSKTYGLKKTSSTTIKDKTEGPRKEEISGLQRNHSEASKEETIQESSSPPEARKRKRKPTHDKEPTLPELEAFIPLSTPPPRHRRRPTTIPKKLSSPTPGTKSTNSPQKAASTSQSTGVEGNAPISHLSGAHVVQPIEIKSALPAKMRSKKKPVHLGNLASEWEDRIYQERTGGGKETRRREKAQCSHVPPGIHAAFSTRARLVHTLSSSKLRRWCQAEWFYSAIDLPWFARNEFVEYLHHAGLGHVEKLTRAEWSVIRSSLGKPRRLSVKFLEEERKKLGQYREAARQHYHELRVGSMPGLVLSPELARPLSVGQRVVAKHPKTGHIYDGSILTVDRGRCRVQFDRQELGVELVQDIDIMPINLAENLPENLRGPRYFPHDGRGVGFMDLRLDSPGDPRPVSSAGGLARAALNEGLEKPSSQQTGCPTMAHVHLSAIFATSMTRHAQELAGHANTPEEVAAARMAVSDALTAIQKAAMATGGSSNPLQVRDSGMRALLDLMSALEKKETLLLDLQQYISKADERQGKVGNSDSHPNTEGNGGQDVKSLEIEYNKLLGHLNEVNVHLQACREALIPPANHDRSHKESTPQHGVGAAKSEKNDQNESSRLAPSIQSSKRDGKLPIGEMAASARRQARAMMAAVLQAIARTKDDEDPFSHLGFALEPFSEDFLSSQIPTSHQSQVTFVLPEVPEAPEYLETRRSSLETQLPGQPSIDYPSLQSSAEPPHCASQDSSFKTNSGRLAEVQVPEPSSVDGTSPKKGEMSSPSFKQKQTMESHSGKVVLGSPSTELKGEMGSKEGKSWELLSKPGGRRPAVPANPLVGLGDIGSVLMGGSGRTYSKEASMLSELMASCVATLLMVQNCTEKRLPQSDVVLTLDSALASLRPHAPQNARVFREIEASIAIIKSEIVTQLPHDFVG